MHGCNITVTNTPAVSTASFSSIFSHIMENFIYLVLFFCLSSISHHFAFLFYICNFDSFAPMRLSPALPAALPAAAPLLFKRHAAPFLSRSPPPRENTD
jgi:hypothetical protein